MRQVGRDELIYVIFAALRKVAPSTWKRAIDHRRELNDQGRVAIATTVADAMQRLEVLSGAPECGVPFGPMLDRMAGHEVGPPALHPDEHL